MAQAWKRRTSLLLIGRNQSPAPSSLQRSLGNVVQVRVEPKAKWWVHPRWPCHRAATWLPSLRRKGCLGPGQAKALCHCTAGGLSIPTPGRGRRGSWASAHLFLGLYSPFRVGPSLPDSHLCPTKAASLRMPCPGLRAHVHLASEPACTLAKSKRPEGWRMGVRKDGE